MTDNLRLLAILAHPDDESLGTGGLIAKYAAEGVEVSLVTATRGEFGWFGEPDENPGPDRLGQIREAELHDAARVLGIKEVHFLDYIDGELDQADPQDVINKLVVHIRRIKPDVVVTFDPNGYYGHPDHIAISQFATSAVLAAADPSFSRNGQSAHRIAKLYYFVPTCDVIGVYEDAFGELVMNIDGVERRSVGWADWAPTTRIDTSAYYDQVWQAVASHRTQLPGYQKLKNLPEEQHQFLWGRQTLYRALSLVNGGRAIETDLFEGLRGDE